MANHVHSRLSGRDPIITKYLEHGRFAADRIKAFSSLPACQGNGVRNQFTNFYSSKKVPKAFAVSRAGGKLIAEFSSWRYVYLI